MKKGDIYERDLEDNAAVVFVFFNVCHCWVGLRGVS